MDRQSDPSGMLAHKYWRRRWRRALGPARLAYDPPVPRPAAPRVNSANPQGVTFLDIFPILRDPYALETLVTHLVSHITQQYTTKPDVIVGLDARGFLLGPIIAMRLGAAFVPVRKAGKLPGECEVAEFEKEYGVDRFEMQKGAIKPGQTVIVFE